MPFPAAAPRSHRLAGGSEPWRRALLPLSCLVIAGLWHSAAPAADKPAAAAAPPAPSSKASAPSPGAPASAPEARQPDYLSDKRLNPRTPPPPKSGASGAAAAAPVIQDPMDRLQERLAERLGARMAAAEAKKDGELRLVARPAPGEAVPKAGGSSGGGSPGSRGGAAAGKGDRGDRHAGAVSPLAWSYEGAGGPEHWASLRPEYANCAKGYRQSPIDIRDGIRLQLDPLQFAYQAGSAFRVVDDGHTVRVHVAAGSFLEVMGRRYELKHFQFHRPSEVRIDGRAFDMSAHLVHEDDQGHTAIVAVPLERGGAHPVVQAVWNNLPLEKNLEQAARSPLDLNGLLPTDRRYATFMGSMTSPPCQEGVLWLVMKAPVAVSDYQLAVFARLYPMNARPVQPAHGRMIKESE